MAKRVIVIGGGVIGGFVAYYLRHFGNEVVVLEANDFGRACSHANCGLVCPSHVLPLAVPGAVRQSFRAMLGRRSPLYIKPRLSPALWSWMWQFARRCNQRQMLAAGQGRLALLKSSMELYEDLLADCHSEVEWENQGCLMVHTHHDSFEAYQATNDLIREHFGIAAEPVAPDDLQEMEPSLVEGLAGAWHYAGDAHLRPDRMMSNLRRRLVDLDVSIQTQTSVAGFELVNGRCRAAVDQNGVRHEADAFVVATGATAPMLQAALGVRIPIQPGKGYSITTERPEQCPRRPLIFEAHKVVATPMQSGFRLGSTMEFSGYDKRLNEDRLQALVEGASHYLRQPCGDTITEKWYGWRPMTYDGLPILDVLPSAKNTWLAAGHNMLGLSMGPATGKLVAELISGETTHVDPAPYRWKSRRLARG